MPINRSKNFVQPYERYPPFGRSGIKFVMVYSQDTSDAMELRGPEWCLFCLETNGNVPDIKDQFNVLNNMWGWDGFFVTDHLLSRAEKISHWRPYTDGDDATKAVMQWKTMLEDIYTIKYLANLAETKLLALSSSIKLSKTGRRYEEVVGRIGSKISLDMFRVKKEFVESSFE